MSISPDPLPDDTQALKRIIAAMAQDAVTAQAEIAKLRFRLARYRRAEFGRSSEKLTREADQLELAIETLEADQAERLAAASPVVAAAIEAATEAQKPARRPLPEHLPREEVRHGAPSACPSCAGALRRIGEDVTETLDYVPGRFKVIRHVRAKLSCRACDTVVAALAPDHAIARDRAGAGLLAHIAVSKYDDHLPLYRQAEIFAREDVNLETSTLSGWVGATAAALQPLIDALAAEVMASDTLHVDDTPVPVLAPGTGKTTSTVMPGSTSCSPAIGSPRPAAGRMCGESSSMCTPPSARRSPRRRSIASASSIASRRRSKARPPTTADENANGDQNQSPRRSPPGRTRPCASYRANPSWPAPSATCGGAGLPSSAASMMVAWRSTTTRPSAVFRPLFDQPDPDLGRSKTGGPQQKGSPILMERCVDP